MLALVLFVALQVNPSGPHVDDDGVVRGRALDMTQLDVHGNVVTPNGASVWGRPKAHKKNLIEMRTNFRPELAKSRDALATSP